MQFPHYTGHDEDNLSIIPYYCCIVGLSLSFLVCKPSLHVASRWLFAQRPWFDTGASVWFNSDTRTDQHDGIWQLLVGSFAHRNDMRSPDCRLEGLYGARSWCLSRQQTSLSIALHRGIMAEITWISFYTNLVLVFSFFLSSPFLWFCS